MTLREKQRLQRIVRANASGYNDARRAACLAIMRGKTDEATFTSLRHDLTRCALGIAEAVASLEDHANQEMP